MHGTRQRALTRAFGRRTCRSRPPLPTVRYVSQSRRTRALPLQSGPGVYGMARAHTFHGGHTTIPRHVKRTKCFQGRTSEQAALHLLSQPKPSIATPTYPCPPGTSHEVSQAVKCHQNAVHLAHDGVCSLQCQPPNQPRSHALSRTPNHPLHPGPRPAAKASRAAEERLPHAQPFLPLPSPLPT